MSTPSHRYYYEGEGLRRFMKIPRIGASRATMRAVAAGIPLGPNGGVIEHPYQADPQSGAGNCVCGRHEGHKLHQVTP